MADYAGFCGGEGSKVHKHHSRWQQILTVAGFTFRMVVVEVVVYVEQWFYSLALQLQVSKAF